MTQEELEILIEQGTQSGVFEEIEQDMLESVLRLDERHVESLMTVRTQIVYFDISDSVEDILHKIENSNHSRFPVVEDNLDNVLGIVRVTDLLIQDLTHQKFDVKPLLHPPLFVPESTTALEVLDLFKKEGIHIALVTDEYGGVEGLVTHNDILETIVGYIPSMDESVEPEIVHREDGSWLLDGLLPIEKFKEVFNVDALPDEDQGHYQTLGGFVMSQIGAIPVTGQHFEWGHMRFEVVDMDGRRVDKVLMTTRESKTSDSTQATDKNETST